MVVTAFRRAVAAVFVVSAMLACVPVAQARMHHVKPGEVPELEAGEGLVVVAVDTSMDVASVRVRRDGAFFGAGVMRDVPEGRSLRLYAVPAGRYEWAQIKPFRHFAYDLSDSEEFEFTVEAGRITYAGDLIFRPRTVYDSTIHVSNRGLAAIDWLQREHPSVYQQHPFAYSGYYPDPFPEFYRGVVAALPAPPDAKAVLAPPPSPGTLPLPVRKLWKDDRVIEARMNPAGDLVAVQVKLDDKRWQVELIDLHAGSVTALVASNVALGGMMWSGDRVVLIPVSDEGAEEFHVVRIEDAAGGHRAFTRMELPRRGVVVDSLADQPDHILFATLASQGERVVHRLDIGSQAALDRFRFPMRERLNAGLRDDHAWYTDGQGRLRLAVATREFPGEDGKPEKHHVLMHGGDGAFREVMRVESEEPFIAVGLSADGSRVYGITEKDRAQRELVVFDPSAGRITQTLFSRPGVDVVDVIFDWRHEAAGVRYYQRGRLVSEYFDAATNAQAGLLRATFPGRNVMAGGRSRDGSQLLLWVEAGDQPAQLYHVDVARKSATLLDESMPWLAPAQLAPTLPFAFKGADGRSLDAFLTLPEGSAKRPLIVFPHGGPIGVSDKLHFDPEVQFLASLGYAVLRVNYRGSEGYGKAFREAGHGQYGTAIEDDIDAATRHALAHYPLDPKRMCAVGSSYGGYSSLVSAIRWPERFRCVVSIAGVSDRILFFTASDAGRHKKGRKALEEVIGDPRTQLDLMKRTSPLYHYDELKVPVMLVHGRDDLRVDYEHARRLQRMLELDGRPPVGIVFDKEGHGMEDIDNIEAMWNGIAGFLHRHLGVSATGGKVAVTASSTHGEG